MSTVKKTKSTAKKPAVKKQAAAPAASVATKAAAGDQNHGGAEGSGVRRRDFIHVAAAIKTSWRKQPVFIRNLTPAEVEEANKVDVGSLRDPQTLAERTKPGKENWLITLGVCTHLGCVPLGAASGEVKGEYGGYFCPCHGSHYDTAARIRKGPAPLNLAVPEFAFISDTVVKIG